MVTLDRLTDTATVLVINGQELLFSYTTLVGVEVNGALYVQRDGAASSRTTGTHINKWLHGRKAETVSQEALSAMVR